MKLNSVFPFVLLSVYTYTSQLFLSPVYLFFIIFMAMTTVFFIMLNKKFTVDYTFFFGFFGLIYSLAILSVVKDYGTYLNFIMVILLMLLYPYLFKGYRVWGDRKVFFVLFLLLVLYIVEGANRYINPILPSGFIDKADESLLFYQYKYNSIMFTDSNFVALSLISLLSMVITILNVGVVKKLVVFIIILLIVFTLSRAAYISTFALLFLYYSGRRSIIIACIIACCLAFVFVVFYLPIILLDGSYLSKVEILYLFQKYLVKIDVVTLLLGSGIGSSVDALGIGSHNLFVLLVVEFGLIGFLWFILYVIYNIFSTSFKTMPYWVAILLCGFSLGGIYAFVFLPALVITYQKKSNTSDF